MYCGCIESRIPKVKERSRKEILDPRDYGAEDDTEVEINIETKLRAAGLEPYEIELVIARAMQGWSFKRILRDLGWTSLDSASYYYKKALKKLRKVGFRL